MKKALLFTAVVTALFASSCAVADGVKDGAATVGNGVVSFAKEGVGIREEAGAREIVLDLNPDATSLPLIMSMVEPVVADAAEDGAVIEMWVITGGVSAAMTPVDLEAANGGDLRFQGQNAASWNREADENTRAVLAATEFALEQSKRDGTGADLFGAVSVAASRVTELPGSDHPEVYLITGGGIHRTEAVDLVKVDFGATNPTDVAARIAPLDAPGVDIQIIGAGRFPRVSPPPDAGWSAGVHSVWREFCAAARTDSCTVRDRMTREEG